MAALKVSWEQALAWRMQRQLLDPVGQEPAATVVRRLCLVQAQVASSAEFAIRVRRESSKAGEVARALSEGRLIKTWAMRGTLHAGIVRVAWFKEGGRPPHKALEAEVARLSSILERDLAVQISPV